MAAVAHLTLEAAAARSGRAEGVLRRWCATGRIACDRGVDHRWMIPERELERLARPARPALEPPARILLPAWAGGRAAIALAERLARALGLGRGSVELAHLAIDGEDHTLASWSGADRLPDERTVRDVAAAYGGAILEDDEVEQSVAG
jgi:hypothetical protein